jgi:hypothetical protein
METEINIKACWERGKSAELASPPLLMKDLQAIAASRVRKELKVVSKYVWAMLVYQIILYSFLAHTIVRQWGDSRTLWLCLACVAAYVPLTRALLQRIRMLYRLSAADDSSAVDILSTVERKHAALCSFFRFKKRMDWIGVPVSCAIIVVVTFALFGNGVGSNPIASGALFTVWVGMSMVAICAENRKRFVEPIRQLELVLHDLKRT